MICPQMSVYVACFCWAGCWVHTPQISVYSGSLYLNVPLVISSSDERRTQPYAMGYHIGESK